MGDLVQLHRDPIEGARVLALPAWLGPETADTRGRARYWHQPRSAYMRSDAEVERGLGLFVVSLWCGQARYLETLDFFTSSPPADLRCGTCVGRATGARREGGLIYSPRDVFALPTWCPGEDADHDSELCIACGHRVRYHSRGYHYGPARHRPTPELERRCSPCPRHGWLHMRTTGGRRYDGQPDTPARLVCGSHGCAFVGGPRPTLALA